MSKKRKYKPATGKKPEEENSLRNFILFSIIFIGLMMWLYGMSAAYFPDPIHIGFGQYIDIGTGIVWGGIMLYSIISILVFKRVM